MPEPLFKETIEMDPSLQEQTLELGRTLKTISEEDPAGAPTLMAVDVFQRWVAQAGPTSSKPAFFLDVADNFDCAQNTNKDLFTLFDMLVNYIEEEELPPLPATTFISLPIAGFDVPAESRME